jgi:hypothetical protein
VTQFPAKERVWLWTSKAAVYIYSAKEHSQAADGEFGIQTDQPDRYRAF